MISQIDNIIFPDRCEVLELESQRYVYPIFKNGSTSLSRAAIRTLGIDELQTIETVDVFVRDPYDRFLTGAQTYLSHNTHLHRETALHFISEYLFLNRHFCPQFHWLVNLQRHTSVSMRLLPMEQISEVTQAVKNQHPRDPGLEQYFDGNLKVQFYLQLDKVLTETLLGRTVTMGDIIKEIADKYPTVYDEVIGRSLRICTALV